MLIMSFKKLFMVSFGLVIFIGILGSFLPPEKVTAEHTSMTLAEYKDKPKKFRQSLVSYLAEQQKILTDDWPHFANCIADFAASKSSSLFVTEIFGWCDGERTSDRELFTSHFNALDNDYRGDTITACKEHIENGVLSVPELSHPWLPDMLWYQGGGTSVLESYFDAPNLFGVKVRVNYRCVVRYDKPDTTFPNGRWIVEKFSTS